MVCRNRVPGAAQSSSSSSSSLSSRPAHWRPRLRFGGAAGDTAGGAGGVFSGGVAGRFFSSSLTARGRLAGASLASFSGGGGASSLCRGDERGRLLRVLSKSILFRGRGVYLNAARAAGFWQSVRRLKVLYSTGVCFGRGLGWSFWDVGRGFEMVLRVRLGLGSAFAALKRAGQSCLAC